MSNKEDLENKGNKGILTKQTTQNNPELKQQVEEINKEACYVRDVSLKLN